MSRVLLLLPPSEAKIRGGEGPPLGDELPGPLGRARHDVLTAVAAYCRRAPRKAPLVLKLPKGSAAADVADNLAALETPTMATLDRFCGVLFEALDVASLTARQRSLATESVLVFSGAFGALRGDEPVPMHRVPASATLPRVGVLATYWRTRLDAFLAPMVDAAGLVVDLRSTDYAAMWHPAVAQRDLVVPVRVLEERRLPDGTVVRRPMSWPSKHGKGRLARDLLRTHTASRPLRRVGQVADAGRRLGYEVVDGPGGNGLDLVAAP